MVVARRVFCSLFIALLVGFARSACDNGIEFYWDDKPQKVFATAYATSDDYSGSHVPQFRGSFIAKITGSHNFKLYSATYSTSEAYTPSSEFVFESISRGQGEKTWYWRTDLSKDFRYAIRFHTIDHY
jgi:hypothetical protein